jgi:hypothetical protein
MRLRDGESVINVRIDEMELLTGSVATNLREVMSEVMSER